MQSDTNFHNKLSVHTTSNEHPPVVFLLHEMVARPERDEMRVVRGGGDGHGPRAPHVGVAQLVREALKLVAVEVVVVPKHVVVRGTGGALWGRREFVNSDLIIK